MLSAPLAQERAALEKMWLLGEDEDEQERVRHERESKRVAVESSVVERIRQEREVQRKAIEHAANSQEEEGMGAECVIGVREDAVNVTREPPEKAGVSDRLSSGRFIRKPRGSTLSFCTQHAIILGFAPSFRVVCHGLISALPSCVPLHPPAKELLAKRRKERLERERRAAAPAAVQDPSGMVSPDQARRPAHVSDRTMGSLEPMEVSSELHESNLSLMPDGGGDRSTLVEGGEADSSKKPSLSNARETLMRLREVCLLSLFVVLVIGVRSGLRISACD